MNKYVEKFISNKEEFHKHKFHTNRSKYNYLIKQVHNLFHIIEDMNKVQSTTYSSNHTHTYYELSSSIAKDSNVTDKVYTELQNLGLDTRYVGCKIMDDLCNIAPVTGITQNTDYETICKILYPDDPNFIKRNITFIRKKCNITFADNMEFIKYFLKLCY